MQNGSSKGQKADHKINSSMTSVALYEHRTPPILQFSKQTYSKINSNENHQTVKAKRNKC